MKRNAWIAGALCLFSAVGCASSRRPASGAYLPSLPSRPPFDLGSVVVRDGRPVGEHDRRLDVLDQSLASGSIPTGDILLSGPLSGAPAARALGARHDVSRSVEHALTSFGGGSQRSGGGSAPLPALPQRDKERIELEAQFTLDVADVSRAADAVHGLVSAHGGVISKEDRHSPPTSGGQAQSTAELQVRVPSERFDAFSAGLAKVGLVRARSVKMTDVALEERDLAIVLENLQAARARYRELLQKATTPGDVLAIEREIERTSSDVDRVQARLDWVRDRISRATVAISLRSPEPDADVDAAREPYFAPGARGLFTFDVGSAGTNVFGGAGLSFRFPQTPSLPWRGLVLDVDLMKACCGSTPARTALAFDVLGGMDIHSASLGGGKRRWLNPYLGFRLGYAETKEKGDFAAAGVVGLELVKTRALALDLQTRFVALLGNPDGPHAAIQPSLGADLGF